MKRMIPLLLLVVLLCSACSSRKETKEMVQPVNFYYRTATTDFSAEDGVIRAELRDMGAELYTEQELFSLYFQGPESDNLIAPFSQDTELIYARRLGSTLELRLTRDAQSPEEFDHSLTYACLAKTGLELEGVNKVRIIVRSKGGAMEDDVTLSENDILLYDNGEDPWNTLNVILYYSDENSRFLLTEKRSVPMMTSQELALHVVKLLAAAPQSAGMRMALPPGTSILDVSVENGICSVDFNADFYNNRPEDEQAEQLALLSVVNTLCGLDGINQVQFYSQGTKLNSYGCLDLSEPWSMDTALVGPIRSELGEFTATLYLPGKTDGRLHKLTVRAKPKGSITREEALLLSLIDRQSQNGLFAPISKIPDPLSVSTLNQVCTVTLVENALPLDATDRELAVRSIAATLSTLPRIQSVKVLEGSQAVTDDPLAPQDDWYYNAP